MTDLGWHDETKTRLQNALTEGRLPHALLIAGYPGWGEVQLGEWLALTLLERTGEQNARELAHPDFRWIAPDGDVIKVEQIRELGEFTQGTAQIANAKVAVIEDAHTMNVHAGNALLKTLEEPPGTTYLILTSHRPGALAATVRSRCQRFDIVADASQAQTWLEQRSALRLMDDYGGGPLLALAATESGERPMTEILSELTGGKRAKVFEELFGEDPGQMSARWARCLVRATAGEIELPGLDSRETRRLFRFVDELWWFHREVTRSNSANTRLLLERLLAKWCSLTIQPSGRSRL